MPNFGRRFMIEPKPQRSNPAYPARSMDVSVAPAKRHDVQRFGDEASSNAISGIRLFPGNSLFASRRYGSPRQQLIADLANHGLIFTVTERGLEPAAFMRVIYRCPRTVFVQTVRGDEDEVPTKQVTALHKTYQFDGMAGQEVIIRPRVSPEEAAVDVEAHGLFVQPWFDAEHGRICLHVVATEAWDVVRA